MRKIILIAHNLRSCHNVGSLFRTAEGLGIEKILLTGYTPYPITENDKRMPHEARKIDKKIAKTALGAEKYVNWQKINDIHNVINKLKEKNYEIFAVEQTKNSRNLSDFCPTDKLVLIIGNEVTGIESEVIKQCDGTLEIPMKGQKESFNAVQAAAMAMYHCTFI